MVYAGVPAGVEAFRLAREVLDAEGITPGAARRDAGRASASSASATWARRWRQPRRGRLRRGRASTPPARTSGCPTARPRPTSVDDVAGPRRHRAAQPARRRRHAGRRRRRSSARRAPACTTVDRPVDGRPEPRPSRPRPGSARPASRTPTGRCRAAWPAPGPATISLMFAGPADVLEAHRPVLEAVRRQRLPRRRRGRAGPGDEAAQQLPVGRRRWRRRRRRSRSDAPTGSTWR